MKNDDLDQYMDQYGTSIYEYSHAAPMLLILLRHSGCPFCRRTLFEISSMQDEFAEQGYSLGFVYLSDPDSMKMVMLQYGLEHLPRFHDPKAKLYRELDLRRLSIRELFNYRTWSNGFQVGFNHGFSWPDGDPLQLPGAFLIDQGVVVAGHASLSPADPPNFQSLLRKSELVA